MKTRLTREESQYMIDLGVPKEKASLLAVKQIYDFRGNSIKNPKEFIRKNPFRPAVMGFEAFDEHPIFQLTDLLEILPKWIDTPEDRYSFAIQRAEMGEWVVGFRRVAVWEMYWKYEELIDALYQLACWYYGEFLKK